MTLYYKSTYGSSLILEDGTPILLKNNFVEIDLSSKTAVVYESYNGPDEYNRFHIRRTPATFYFNVTGVNMIAGSEIVQRWKVKFEEEE